MKEYLNGLRKFGGKFAQVESTIENVISSISVEKSNSSEMAKYLNVTRRRMVSGKKRRKIFDYIIEKEENRNKNNESIESFDYSEINDYSADFGEDETILQSSEDEMESEEDEDNTEIENTEIEYRPLENTEIEPQRTGSGKKNKQNIFVTALTPTERKVRDDKLDLSVVRDYCHEICRLDTFATAKTYVHNYDGTYSYHPVHVKSQSVKSYYEIFQQSTEYHNWQNENARIKTKGNFERRIPTIKLRLFTNAFCPCCMNQKQRDCANHIQINYYNALKAIANMRRFQGISVPMRDCACPGHRNENYLQCHTSVSRFMDAVLCPRIEYPMLSAQSNPSESIEIQQEMNIKVSAEKEQNMIQIGGQRENRNIKREGAARQPKSILLLTWGPLFSCYSKECAYQQCNNCGINKFFNEANLCDIERNKDVEVLVRKYENIQGRSRGMQMEIVEVKMNGDEIVEHLMHCAKLAVPHEWNVKWNAHARTICVNTSKADVLTLMTDFSAVLDHDVQDRLNTAVPCHSNQCIFLATHSPRTVDLNNGAIKRIQDNDVWHLWSGQGGTIEANSYYHSVCTRHILHEYESLNLKRVNIFTDGCAEQYKSRKNAYFVGALAEDTNMVITHNYAPTASFKTMVDGQGNVTKAFYRKLERSEEEGTRCPTTYDLFKLFTSKYPMTPAAVEDCQRNPMTITRRFHRFLVDKIDATPEMIERARTRNDVIITDYIGERWDAPPVKGIKGIFSLMAFKEDGKTKLYSRQHTCFCRRCINDDFKGCEYAEISGPLKEEQIKKLPFKEVPIRSITLSDEALRVNFFRGVLPLNSEFNIVIAVASERKDISDEPFVLGLMTKKIKESLKDTIYEYTINGTRIKSLIKKGTWCIILKLMYCQNVFENEYYIPVKSKEIKVPLLDVYFPADTAELTRENYLQCSMQTTLLGGTQISNVYTIDSNSLEILRTEFTKEV